MLFGYNGKILRVDLSHKKISVEEPGEVFYRTYMGGRSLIAYYLYKELAPEIDPLSPENKLIFAVSVITGAPFPGLGRSSVGAKSPLTGLFGESEAGGYWGPELKFSGYDAIIVEGRSNEPVYLWIKDGEVQICNAAHLWGMDTKDTFELIKKEINDDRIRIEVIGKAGENLVKYAGIASDLRNYHGRTGLGAVMGSKNLKAVVVRGTKKPSFYNLDKVKKLAKWFSQNFKKNVDNNTQNRYGTNKYYFNANIGGSLPTKNWHTGHFDELTYSVDDMHDALKIGSEGCYACPIRCKQIFKSDFPYKIDPAYGGPEYETLSSFGSLCLVKDYNVIAKAHDLCNRYGLDTISTGVTIAFAMECYENGLLTKEQTDGVELNFGNGKAMLEMIEKIASRNGFGDFLADGVKRYAKQLGGNALEYAMHVKGQELPAQEPRAKFGVGLGFALSPTGADHLQAEHDGAFDPKLAGYSHDADEPSIFVRTLNPLGILEPVESLSLEPAKVRLFTYLQHIFSLFNSLEVCIFAFEPVRTAKISFLVDLVKAVTSWETSLWELLKLGERGTTMARCFNIKHGATCEDDTLPERLFTELEGGHFKGSKLDKDEFKRAIRLYYEIMGWNSKGIPTEGKLCELNIHWMYDDLS
jgi:aldehyde:ferredoxin oxidoreductase